MTDQKKRPYRSPEVVGETDFGPECTPVVCVVVAGVAVGVGVGVAAGVWLGGVWCQVVYSKNALWPHDPPPPGPNPPNPPGCDK